MQSEENKESLAMCDETMLEEYLSGGKIEKESRAEYGRLNDILLEDG